MATSRRKMAEDIDEFQRWLTQMLKDAKEKLHLTDGTITWLLSLEVTRYYHKTLCKDSKQPPE